MNKLLARKIGISSRNSLQIDVVKKYSNVICNKLLQFLKEKKCTNIFVYYSNKNEVETISLIKKLIEFGFLVSVPYVVNDVMFASKVDNNTKYSKNMYGIMQPTKLITADKIDVAICPLTAFSDKLERVGMGKGYYDKFLSKNPHIIKIGIGFDNQKVIGIECDSNDVLMDYIFTEKEILEKKWE